MSNSQEVPTLLSVRVSREAQMFVVRYELSGMIPAEKTFLVGVYVSAGNRLHTRLGVKFLNGELLGSFAFDHVEVKQENFSAAEVIVDGPVITSRVPYRHIDAWELAEQGKPFVNYDGNDLPHNVSVEFAN